MSADRPILLGTFAALVVLVASVSVLGLQPAADVDTMTASYRSGGASVSAFMARPSGNRTPPRPGVVVVHDDQGLTGAARGIAELLAAEGFVALVPDLLSRVAGQPEPAPTGGRPPAPVERLSLGDTVRDVRAAFVFLAGDSAVDAARISVIGFGWGGWRAWKLAELTPSLHRAVVFYGTTTDDRRLDQIRAPVLGHYAGYDFATTAQVLATQRRLGDRFTYHVYPDMDRGFFGGGSGAIDYVALIRGREREAPTVAAADASAQVAAAVRLSWERTLAFLTN